MLLQSPVALLFSLVVGMSASAAPVVFKAHLSSRDVWAPPITSPVKGTVWTIGSQVTVTWNPTNPPSEVTDSIGYLLLGHIESDGTGGENLNTTNPLAQNFSLYDGSVTFTVPEVPPNDNYIAVLIGDSGNASPQFTICE